MKQSIFCSFSLSVFISFTMFLNRNDMKTLRYGQHTIWIVMFRMEKHVPSFCCCLFFFVVRCLTSFFCDEIIQSLLHSHIFFVFFQFVGFCFVPPKKLKVVPCADVHMNFDIFTVTNFMIRLLIYYDVNIQVCRCCFKTTICSFSISITLAVCLCGMKLNACHESYKKKQCTVAKDFGESWTTIMF